MSWKCPQCERTLKNANQWHCCTNQDIDNLFVNKPEELLLVFDKILSFVADLGAIEISATKNCVVFFSSQTFLVIRPMQKQLNIKIYLEELSDDELFFKVALYGKQHEHNLRIATLEQVNGEVLGYIKKSYQVFNKAK